MSWRCVSDSVEWTLVRFLWEKRNGLQIPQILGSLRLKSQARFLLQASNSVPRKIHSSPQNEGENIEAMNLGTGPISSDSAVFHPTWFWILTGGNQVTATWNLILTSQWKMRLLSRTTSNIFLRRYWRASFCRINILSFQWDSVIKVVVVSRGGMRRCLLWWDCWGSARYCCWSWGRRVARCVATNILVASTWRKGN